MIEVITPACSYDLTTVDAIKHRLGSVSSEQEIILMSIIKAASDYARNYCGQDFAKEEIRESREGFGGVKLLLSRTPIETVSLVEIDSQTVTDYSIFDKNAGILYRRSGWTYTGLSSGFITGHHIPNTEEKLIEVTYIGGYILPSMDETSRDLPYDIEECVINLVRDQYERITGNIKSVRIGDYSVTYGDIASSTNSATLTSVNSVLDNYKRVDL